MCARFARILWCVTKLFSSQLTIQELEDRIASPEAEQLQAKDDMRLAMKAVSTHEMTSLEDQIVQLKQQLQDERSEHVVHTAASVGPGQGWGLGLGRGSAGRTFNLEKGCMYPKFLC